MKNKQESGRSMVEMVGVLAVMGLITAGAFVLISSGLSSQKRGQVADEIDVIAANARSMSAQATDRAKPYKSLPEYCVRNGSADDTAKGLAEALLGSSISAYGTGTYYTVCQASAAAKFSVALIGLADGECKALAARAYSKGSATCTAKSGNASAYVTVTFDE